MLSEEECQRNLELFPKQPRKARKDSKFSEGERKVLNKYKKTYLAKETSNERNIIMRGSILPAIFNYWEENGRAVCESEHMMKIKEVREFIWRNWRRKSNTAGRGATLRVRNIDVVVETHKDKITEKIKKKLEKPAVSSQEWFNHHKSVAKELISEMPSPERNLVLAEVNKRRTVGLPRTIQIKNAAQKAHKKMTAAAKEWNMEMGMTCLIVGMYEGQNGKYKVEIHDNLVTSASGMKFAEQKEHHAEITQIARKMIDWTKGNIENAAKDVSNNSQIATTAAGYPILPRDFAKLSVAGQRDILRRYMNTSYRLGSGRKQLPWASVQKRSAEFVSAEYLPQGSTLKDPSGCNRGELEAILGHIFKRQEDASPEMAFRFRNFEQGEKMSVTTYPDGSQCSTAVIPRTKKSKNVPKGTPTATAQQIIPLGGLIRMTPDSRESVPPRDAGLLAHAEHPENTEEHSALSFINRPIPDMSHPLALQDNSTNFETIQINFFQTMNDIQNTAIGQLPALPPTGSPPIAPTPIDLGDLDPDLGFSSSATADCGQIDELGRLPPLGHLATGAEDDVTGSAHTAMWPGTSADVGLIGSASSELKETENSLQKRARSPASPQKPQKVRRTADDLAMEEARITGIRGKRSTKPKMRGTW